MKKHNQFSPEVKERAVRLVQEHRQEYSSLWAAVESIAPQIGCVPSTLLDWVKRAEIHQGIRPCQRDSEDSQCFFRPGGARPRTEEINAYIDQHRNLYGVEPICKVLQVAPSAYRKYAARCRQPELRSRRAQMDEQNKVNIYRVWEQNFQVYGARKIWWQMNRQGQCIARCTVERLMRDLEIEGVRRGKVSKGTMVDATLIHAPMGLANLYLLRRRLLTT
jgi:putative transposase